MSVYFTDTGIIDISSIAVICMLSGIIVITATGAIAAAGVVAVTSVIASGVSRGQYLRRVV